MQRVQWCRNARTVPQSIGKRQVGIDLAEEEPRFRLAAQKLGAAGWLIHPSPHCARQRLLQDGAESVNTLWPNVPVTVAMRSTAFEGACRILW